MIKSKGTFYVEKQYLNNKIFSNELNEQEYFKYSKYISIREGFLKHGIQIDTQDIISEEDSDFTIYLDYPKNAQAHKKYLIVREPPIIIPKNHSLKYLKKFDKIFTYNDKLIDGKKIIKFINGSYDFSKIKIAKPKSQSGYVLICRNKKSFRSGECYSLRNRVITFFESKNIKFHLYGFGWDLRAFNNNIIEVFFNRLPINRPKSRFIKNYKGTINNKREKSSEYLFQFAIENSNNTEGYISEKIFDAFFSNNIPIYCGAPNIKNFIPEDCFISVNDFLSIEELIDFTTKLTKLDIETLKKSRDKFLSSSKANLFSADFNSKILINEVINDIKI
ncbi:glycosyltransferase family 10 [Flavobacteriaceae bacterium]|nr:glycosyltransferase family 10 [Flavobacteriaceae bacterium]|tara:strand:+ start:225 stop:1226 length:1002 start_codon:yes stop_codon:yes gene_type:complete